MKKHALFLFFTVFLVSCGLFEERMPEYFDKKIRLTKFYGYTWLWSGTYDISTGNTNYFLVLSKDNITVIKEINGEETDRDTSPASYQNDYRTILNLTLTIDNKELFIQEGDITNINNQVKIYTSGVK